MSVGGGLLVCQVNTSPWAVPFGASPLDTDTLKFPVTERKTEGKATRSELVRVRHLGTGLRRREGEKFNVVKQRVDLEGWLLGRKYSTHGSFAPRTGSELLDGFQPNLTVGASAGTLRVQTSTVPLSKSSSCK